MTEPVLTEGDRHSPTWLRLKAHLEAKLQRLREQNDKDMPEFKRGRLLGHIDDIKETLALGTAQTVLPSEDALFQD